MDQTPWPSLNAILAIRVPPYCPAFHRLFMQPSARAAESVQRHVPSVSHHPHHHLCLGSSGLLGGRGSQLLLRLGLGLSLGPAEGAGAGHGSLPQVRAVAVLGRLLRDALVGPVGGMDVSARPCSLFKGLATNLRVVLLPP